MSLQFDTNARVLWASEASYGTDAVNAILTDGTKEIIYQQVNNLQIQPVAAQEAPARLRGSHSGNKHATIKQHCTVSGEIPLTAFISATAQVPYFAPILKAMNMREDLSTTGEGKYTPATTRQASASIYKFTRQAENDNWRLHKALGTTLSGSIAFAPGSEAKVSVEGFALFEKISAGAQYFSPTTGAIQYLADGTTAVTARDGLAGGDEYIADQTPLMCKGMTVSAGGKSLTVGEASLELNWSTDPIDAITSDPQSAKFVNTRSNEGARIGGNFNLLDATDADFDQLISWALGDNEITLTIALTNADGNVTITAPKMQIFTPEEGANGNLKAWQFGFALNGDASSLLLDNDFELRFH